MEYTGQVTNRRGSNSGSKRKRNSSDQGTAPKARKTVASSYANNSLPAPTANMNDPNVDFLSQHQHFDLSALQSHPVDEAVMQHQDVVQYGQDTNGGSVDTANQALRQHYNMSGPSHQTESFMTSANTVNDGSAYNMEGGHPVANDLSGLEIPARAASSNSGNNSDAGPVPAGKPSIGTAAWHQVRKDNHKEVERRRRETINEGINEIAKIVPGTEKNKGAILQRCISYIGKLQDDANQNINKWTFEKLITEQAINDLSNKLTRGWNEKEFWKRVAREAGVDMDAAIANLAIELDIAVGAEELGHGQEEAVQQGGEHAADDGEAGGVDSSVAHGHDGQV